MGYKFFRKMAVPKRSHRGATMSLPASTACAVRWNFLGSVSVTFLSLFVLVIFLSGCTSRVLPKQDNFPSLIEEYAKKKSNTTPAPLLKERRVNSTESVIKQPQFKKLSPLDVGRISMNFVDASYKEVYHALAEAAGLNLILDSGLDSFVGQQMLTATYHEMRIRPILDAISHILDISWKEEFGTLFVQPWISTIIHLDFLSSIRQSNFDVGGDVLGGVAGSQGGGGSSSSIVTPLTGRFEISGETTDTVTDIYSNIEETVKDQLGEGGSFLLNRQTGTLMLRGRPGRVKEITAYLNDLRKLYSRQVLIEAKIIEVGLNKGHQFGIDWKQLALTASTRPFQDAALKVFTVDGDPQGTDAIYNVRFDAEYYTLSGIFRALKQFGNLRVLSNPRIKAMNGQSAMISVGQSVSYLRSLTQTTQGTGDNRSTDLSTEIGAVFDGILLGVTPIIRDDNSVTLHIVPIKSDLVELDQQKLSNDKALTVTFPKVNLREMSTVVNAQNGDLLVLGGLIMERKREREEGLPWLSDAPVIGGLFKQRKTDEQRVEMIIILQVTVRNPNE